jgi:hypothetical protein
MALSFRFYRDPSGQSWPTTTRARAFRDELERLLETGGVFHGRGWTALRTVGGLTWLEQ